MYIPNLNGIEMLIPIVSLASYRYRTVKSNWFVSNWANNGSQFAGRIWLASRSIYRKTRMELPFYFTRISLIFSEVMEYVTGFFRSSAREKLSIWLDSIHYVIQSKRLYWVSTEW